MVGLLVHACCTGENSAAKGAGVSLYLQDHVQGGVRVVGESFAERGELLD